jgi:mycofactocin biosynthetic radical S-adenosylmethionine protein MftC
MTGFSIGIGLTSACNLACRHCYSRSGAVTHCSTDLLMRVLDVLEPGTVNIGTGEAAMHPGFESAMDSLLSRGIPLSLTSNGYSILALPEEKLAGLHDVDISLDFPDRAGHDAWRGTGSFDTAIEAVARCRSAGVTCSVAFCLMECNAPAAGAMGGLCSELGVALRVNVYKPVRTRGLSPGYGAFWSAVADLGRECVLASCSEPIVNAALSASGHEVAAAAHTCGSGSLRISPDGEVNGCVYVRGSGVLVEDLLRDPSLIGKVRAVQSSAPVPEACAGCAHLPVCRGGCFGRRFYTGLDQRDEFCFVGRDLPALPAPRFLDSGLWVHAGYLCTLIYTPG